MTRLQQLRDPETTVVEIIDLLEGFCPMQTGAPCEVLDAAEAARLPDKEIDKMCRECVCKWLEAEVVNSDA